MGKIASDVVIGVCTVLTVLSVLGMTYVPLSLVIEDIKKRRRNRK